jgi:hypothetical protein
MFRLSSTNELYTSAREIVTREIMKTKHKGKDIYHLKRGDINFQKVAADPITGKRSHMH